MGKISAGLSSQCDSHSDAPVTFDFTPKMWKTNTLGGGFESPPIEGLRGGIIGGPLKVKIWSQKKNSVKNNGKNEQLLVKTFFSKLIFDDFLLVKFSKLPKFQ